MYSRGTTLLSLAALLKRNNAPRRGQHDNVRLTPSSGVACHTLLSPVCTYPGSLEIAAE